MAQLPKFVAFYPAPDDPGANLSTAVVASVTRLNNDGTLDLEVDGVPVLGVPHLPEGEHATPHTWSP